MKETRTFHWRLWLRPGLVLPAVLAGCLCRDSKLVDKCSTIPAGAIPPPIGTHTNEIYARQVNKAEMDQFVIYLYEWQGDSANFGPFGSRHIERMAARLPQVTFPVIIEPDCDRGVNEAARRLTVIAYLEQKCIANASQVVEIGYPIAEGIYGDEAPRIYRQLLVPQTGYGNRNNSQGALQSGTQGAFGGMQGFGGQLR